MAKRKKAQASGDDWHLCLEEFLASDLAERASSGLSDRACIGLHVDGQNFFFRRQKGVNTLTRVEPFAPDVHFWLPLPALRHLLGLAANSQTGVGTLGVAIFEHLFAKDEAKKIKFRVDTGFLGLWSKGYFSVLKAGGPEVASYLGRVGFGSLSAIKDVLQKIRG